MKIKEIEICQSHVGSTNNSSLLNRASTQEVIFRRRILSPLDLECQTITEPVINRSDVSGSECIQSKLLKFQLQKKRFVNVFKTLLFSNLHH